MKQRKSHRNCVGFGVRCKDTRNIARVGLAMAIIVASASMALCCSIPVFRYALEHWRPELFLIHVISSSPLNAHDESLFKQAESSSGIANARWVISDGSDLESEEWKGIVGKAKVANSVWLAVESTKKSVDAKPLIWDSPFTKQAISQLLSSPVRDRVCNGLVDKDSVAWVFLESGVPAKDDAKFAKLESELRRLEGVIKLPVIEEADLKDLSKRPEELKVQFSAHRLSRSDPLEAAFISMLLATESDLQEEFDRGTPMAFPIFGRGRVLYALLGDGIATSTIEEACRFLTGACQCTVKADNPGIDLLIAFDWDSHVQITEPKKADDLLFTGLGSFANKGKERLEQSSSLPSDERSKKAEATESESQRSKDNKLADLNTTEATESTKLDGGSELSFVLPKPISNFPSTWVTLGVLAAIVCVATMVGKFIIGTKS